MPRGTELARNCGCPEQRAPSSHVGASAKHVLLPREAGFRERVAGQDDGVVDGACARGADVHPDVRQLVQKHRCEIELEIPLLTRRGLVVVVPHGLVKLFAADEDHGLGTLRP
jgi:hypothetical protein